MPVVCHNLTGLLTDTQEHDFVISSVIIEHVSNINLFMQVLQRLTRDRGHAYITTPDIGHSLVPDEINDWDVFTPPVHVQFFNRRSARTLFEKYGFEILKFYPNKKPGLIFLARKSGQPVTVTR